MKKILVTGSNGQLGKELRDIAPAHGDFEFLFLSREDLPIHHYELVRNVFTSYKPDFCINCAAYTAVDKAEQEQELAHLVNAESVGVLAKISKEVGANFIHISTDYVYGGEGTIPFSEDDPTHPVSVYGISKKLGEEQALDNHPESVIIRTSWVYSYYGHNFVKTMIRLMKEKDAISVVNDQIGSPTWAKDLANFIMKVIEHPEWYPGIYNFSDSGEISWYDFAMEIKSISGSNCKINPIPTSEFPTPARRPAYSVMNKSKIQRVFGCTPPDWKKSLHDCMERLLQS